METCKTFYLETAQERQGFAANQNVALNGLASNGRGLERGQSLSSDGYETDSSIETSDFQIAPGFYSYDEEDFTSPGYDADTDKDGNGDVDQDGFIGSEPSDPYDPVSADIHDFEEDMTDDSHHFYGPQHDWHELPRSMQDHILQMHGLTHDQLDLLPDMWRPGFHEEYGPICMQDPKWYGGSWPSISVRDQIN